MAINIVLFYLLYWHKHNWKSILLCYTAVYIVWNWKLRFIGQQHIRYNITILFALFSNNELVLIRNKKTLEDATFLYHPMYVNLWFKNKMCPFWIHVNNLLARWCCSDSLRKRYCFTITDTVSFCSVFVCLFLMFLWGFLVCFCFG